MRKRKSNRPTAWGMLKENMSLLLFLCWAATLGIIALSAVLYWKQIF